MQLLHRLEPRPDLTMEPQSRAGKHRVFRPMVGGITLFSGALGTTAAASLTGHQGIALGGLLVTVVSLATIAGDLWIAKRRDDVFRRVAVGRRPNPAVLRALTVHEAVRSGLLSSEDAARLLRDGSDDTEPVAETVTPVTETASGGGKRRSRADPFGTMRSS